MSHFVSVANEIVENSYYYSEFPLARNKIHMRLHVHQLIFSADEIAIMSVEAVIPLLHPIS